MNDAFFDRNYKPKKKRGGINYYRSSCPSTSYKSYHEKGSLKSCSSLDDSKNSEDYRKDSIGRRCPPEEWGNYEDSPWRSPSDDCKNSENHSWGDSPEEWVIYEDSSWRSPSDDYKNFEERSWGYHSTGWTYPPKEWGNYESTTQKSCAFSDDFSSIEESKNINESSVCNLPDSENSLNQPRSKVMQETDSENQKDETNQISGGNFSKEIDTIYDTTNNLSYDFLSALEKNSFHDVSIKCGDHVREVHKFVLAARSPVFEAMFTIPMEESDKGVVTISDIDPSVLDDLLAFIYGAQVKSMTLSKACDLLYVAEKYQVKGLKDICTNYLRSCLSIPNAIQILQFADLYDEKLKKNVLNYVCENFSVLKITEEWKALQSQKPNLSIDVYSVVVEKHEELLGSKNSDCPKGTPTSTSNTSWTCRFCTFSNKSQDTFCDECSIPR